MTRHTQHRSDHDGRVVLVTGASRGIGREIARTFWEEGAIVYANSRDASRAEAACRNVDPSAGGRMRAVAADVADPAQVEAMFETITADGGSLDVLVNNAGIPSRKGLLDMDVDHWRDVIDVNLTSVLHCTRLAAPIMMRQRSGHVVNMSSFAATFSGIERGAYAAAKAGVEAVTKVWAAELAPYGIKVNAVAPGDIDTDIIADLKGDAEAQLLGRIALRRLGGPDEVANVVAFLASPAASYLTGIVIPIAGGKFVVQNAADAWARHDERGRSGIDTEGIGEAGGNRTE